MIYDLRLPTSVMEDFKALNKLNDFNDLYDLPFTAYCLLLTTYFLSKPALSDKLKTKGPRRSASPVSVK
jgi:hypothetical protein